MKEKEEILVSIVIPVYNAEKYLRKCMTSVVEQSLKDIEIICVDDGSMDRSLEILREYADRDNRIRLYCHKNDGKGAAAARNIGLEKARGKYILFLDSDDWFVPKLAETVYQKAEETEADIVIFDAYWYDNEKDKILSKHPKIISKKEVPAKNIFSPLDCPDTLFQISLGAAWNKLFRREFIEVSGLKFQTVYHADDAFFVYAAMSSAKRITMLYEKLLYYRANVDTGQSNTRDKSPLSAPLFVLKLKEYLKKTGMYETLKVSFLCEGLGYCLWYLDTMKTYRAFHELFQFLQEKIIPELLGSVADKEAVEDKLCKRYCQIEELDENEYLFKYIKYWEERCDKLFPTELVLPTDRVIMYGAGDVGKQYFRENFENSYCNIVGWADKRYLEFGFPLIAPTEIKGQSYDKILIAVEKRELAEEIRKELIEMGLENRSIVWAEPYREDER